MLPSLLRDLRDILPRTSIHLANGILRACTAVTSACDDLADLALILGDLDNEAVDAADLLVGDDHGAN